jgi:chromosome segregation protein
MQLTKLEIKGFKSFADRVVINFDEGITGIVGPNGCGKSNVVDAIRWVLGEQKTRVLRSEKMENIIFNGTKARKPTQLAEVSLTFNNTKNLIPTEYSQVTITRRYYRSGDSEYMLNGVTCRLKDINNLFLDTGISSNSYAIIELKMVDDILNDKDNSRRTLFEEAAGISKFKIRKKETLRKLEDTDADLDRVEDLLFEIEKNLRSLERQAKQAQKYYQFKEEYKNTSIALAQKSIVTQRENLANIEQKIQNQSDQKSGFVVQLKEKEAAIEQSKTELIKKEKLLSSCQKELNEHVSKIRQYESDKKIKNERQRFLNDKIESLREQIAQDKQSNERAAFSLESLRKEDDTARTILKDIRTRLDVLKDAYDNQKNLNIESQQGLNETSTSFSSKREVVYSLNKDIEIKEIQLRTIQNELNKTQEDSSQHSANLQEFDQRLGTISKEKEEKTRAYEKLKSAEDQIADKHETLQQQVDLIKDELTQINRQLDAKSNEYSLTKSLVDNLEGFPDAIRFLKKSDQWRKAPLVSDIITCPMEYRVTVENFLEPYMNYYVVESADDAFKAVNLLSDASRGKANFFILDKLDSHQNESELMIPGATPATEVVEYETKYKKLISYLLSNVFIYDGAMPAVSPKEDAVLLDITGKVTQRRYSVSGGSVGLFEGKRIGRAKNLEKLAEDIKKLEKRQSSTQASLHEKQHEVNQLKEASRQSLLENMKEELAHIGEMYVSIHSKQEQFNELLSSSKVKREDMTEQAEELEKALTELRPQQRNEQEKLETLSGLLESQKLEMEALNERLSQKSASFNEENVLSHRQENKVSSIQQEITYKQEAYENSLERIEKNTEELQLVTANLNELVKKSTENDDQLVEMYDEKEKHEKTVNDAEKAYYEARGTIDTAEKSLREIQHQRESIDQLLMEWQEKRSESQLQLQSVKDRLSVEFQVDAEKLGGDITEEYQAQSESSLRSTVDQLRSKMENMGPINPMAMEAYEEIQERHVFITSQKEDLNKAKESLLTTIAEIDVVAKETFMEAFTKIHDHFVNVFRALFTEEDDCDLKLTDPDNPLDSSIEIIAKPKGKRPLTINQLSGGEKTLTATALLFSIYLLKPAPFCIFDEVDAPLDDANIDKFNEIIRQFSKDSQFIIVTHNKRTMASTDVIYGITMIEQGISRVVPVDLRELA